MEPKQKFYNEHYQKIKLIGQGSGGKVYLCRYFNQPQQNSPLTQLKQCNIENQNPNYAIDKQQPNDQQSNKSDNLKQKEFLVIKKFINLDLSKENKGISPETINEIRVLKQLKHPNILQIQDIFVVEKKYQLQVQKNICVSMEFMADLKSLKEFDVYKQLTMQDKKCIIKQIFEGVKYLHDQNILHRDIKPDNIFINDRGQIVIGDFGLARPCGNSNSDMTPKVVTKYYRPPELFFLARNYGKGVDLWSLGCTVAEILQNGEVLFQEQTEIQMLTKIFEKRGTPTEKNWEGCKKYQYCIEFTEKSAQPMNKQLKNVDDPNALDLVDQLLQLDPNKRLTTEKGLQHQFLKDAPTVSQTKLAQIGKFLIQQKQSKLLLKK